MSRKQVEKAARKMGVTVQACRRSGEIKFVFPSGRQIKANGRRKDAPLVVVKALMDETR